MPEKLKKAPNANQRKIGCSLRACPMQCPLASARGTFSYNPLQATASQRRDTERKRKNILEASLCWLKGQHYHPGRNYYKIIPWPNNFCNNLCKYYKIIPPEHFVCNVAANGLSLFAREHAKKLLCKKHIL